MIIGVTAAACAHMVETVALNTQTKPALVILSLRYCVGGKSPDPGTPVDSTAPARETDHFHGDTCA